MDTLDILTVSLLVVAVTTQGDLSRWPLGWNLERHWFSRGRLLQWGRSLDGSPLWRGWLEGLISSKGKGGRKGGGKGNGGNTSSPLPVRCGTRDLPPPSPWERPPRVIPVYVDPTDPNWLDAISRLLAFGRHARLQEQQAAEMIRASHDAEPSSFEELPLTDRPHLPISKEHHHD